MYKEAEMVAISKISNISQEIHINCTTVLNSAFLLDPAECWVTSKDIEKHLNIYLQRLSVIPSNLLLTGASCSRLMLAEALPSSFQ